MKSKYSDLVASSMNATLNNPEYQSLFKSYKMASDENYAKKNVKKCPECGEHMKHDKCDCGYSDDDMSMADDNDMDITMPEEEPMPSEPMPSEPMPEPEPLSVSGYDVAIDSLLTASAALDHLNLGHQSSMALKLASLVSEAKKLSKEERAENFKKMLAAKKEKEMKDKNKAKDKAMKEKMMAKEKAEKAKAKAKAEKVKTKK